MSDFVSSFRRLPGLEGGQMGYLVETIDKSVVSVPILPEASSRDVLPLLVPEIIHQYHQDLHFGRKGLVPGVNLYRFADASVGPYGTIISRDNRINCAKDIIGSQYSFDFIQNRIMANDPADPLIRAVTGVSDILQGGDGDVFFVLNRPGCGVYGHWLLDILPMLYVLHQLARGGDGAADGLGIDISKLKYVLPTGVPKWTANFLEMLFGITEDQLVFYPEATAVFRARNLIVASQMRYGDFFSQEMDGYVEFIKEKISPLSSNECFPENIFITRNGVNSFIPRDVHNEAALIALAERRGLAIVDPAALSWPDQVKLFSKAKLVCGPFGSGLHNTIFSEPDAVCFSLGSSRMNWLQSGLAALRLQRMAYLMPTYEDFRDGKNVMVYDTERFLFGLEHITKS